MAFIDWTDEKYSVKIKEIDAQHQQLVHLTNELYEGIKTRKAKEILEGLLDELIEYTANHFGTEEKYFDKWGYKDTQSHKATHKQFVDEVLQFKADYLAGKLFLSKKIMAFLKDWLVKHIQGDDQKYIEFMHANGVK
ncbi:MAG: bacteriohemerythrin [Candidatus Cloacimonadota bacterium]|nr:bacteriohemerythrin [Candidatus Cloacimonadota bacterium]